MRHWLVAAGMLWSVMASAAQSPTGLWRTIDDETGKERSIVRVFEVNGELQGVVEKIIDRPGDDPAHLCKKCEGDRKDKPVIGMAILWGLKKKSDTEYAGGQIMDPKNGKIFRCKLKLIEQGKKLEVRGYIGVSLIGRSQVWLREE
ncbi:MAG: DUF2147 domain-containing protein [Betaproteobacteria bacterium]|nr:DUF2147 domain-containing protein [Betaproteobacteria bacterium]